MFVKIEDLKPYSSFSIQYECDNCNEIKNIRMADYSMNNHNGKYYCHSCAIRLLNSGQDNHKWNPTLTDEERTLNRATPEYAYFVKSVMYRDNFTCRCCGNHADDVHHLNGWNWYVEGRYDDSNGISLCTNCHKNFHSIYGYGNNIKEQFEEWIGYTLPLLEKYDGKLPTRKMVYNVTKNILYDDKYKASEASGIKCETIEKGCFTKNVQTKDECLYLWYEDYLSLSEYEKIIYKTKKSKAHYQVICLNNGQLYGSIDDTSSTLNIPKRTINKILNKKTKHPRSGYYFIKLSEFLILSKEKQLELVNKYISSYTYDSFLFTYFNSMT